mmetsp:Transcript_30535/g.73250  ORF Transcript_30535/g.73250 Transcript_30535/m.73250 type:complete len:938 (+) Transcript_30535:197-3010(+)
MIIVSISNIRTYPNPAPTIIGCGNRVSDSQFPTSTETFNRKSTEMQTASAVKDTARRDTHHHHHPRRRPEECKQGLRKHHGASGPGAEPVGRHEMRSVENRAIEKEHRHHHHRTRDESPRTHSSRPSDFKGDRHHEASRPGVEPAGRHEMRSVEDRATEKERRSHHRSRESSRTHSSSRPSDSKRDRHHGASRPGAERLESHEVSRGSAEGRAREKERRSHGGRTSNRDAVSSRPSDSKGGHDHHRGQRNSPQATPDASIDGSGPMLEAELASDREKEIDDRLDRLDDVEKAYREKLTNLETPTNDGGLAVVEENDSKKCSITRCSKPVLFALLLLLLGAIAAGIWFVASNKEDPSVYITVIYDPPTAQECKDIANGAVLEGQTTMRIESYNVDMEVHSTLVEELPAQMEEINAMVQQSVVTTLAGCGDDYVLPNQNYVVASGSANVTHQANETCFHPSDCFRVQVNIDLYLKGDAPVETLQGWIEEALDQDMSSADTPLWRVLSVNPIANATDETLPREPTPRPNITVTYDPPPAQECQDIANGVVLDGQTTMQIESYNADIEVRSTLEEELAAQMEEIHAIVQQSVVTTLAGCGDDYVLPNQNYVVATGSANVTHQANETCFYPSDCFRVQVNIDLYLKGDAPVETLQGWIEEALDQDMNSADTPLWRVLSVNPIAKPTDETTPSPANGTPNPTIPPSTLHSTSPISCFSSTSELRKAVDDWFTTLREAVETTYGTIGQWCFTSNLTDMSELFEHQSTFNQDISAWDVSSVTNMSYMYYGAHSFDQDLSAWDVSSVTDMTAMFYNANRFNKHLSSWNVSAVTAMPAMFYYAESFNQDLSTWDVSSVIDMEAMFRVASAFNQDLSTWNVSSLTKMERMFDLASSFNQDLCAWGPKLIQPGKSHISLVGLFPNTSCPTVLSPNLMDSPPGPFCHPCT